MRLFGARAVESMRLEKGFRHWKADLITEYDPIESGLDRFVKLDKESIGRDAVMARDTPRKLFVSLVVDCSHAPAHPGASIRVDGRVVGTVTSGDWGHRVGENLAMGFIDPEFAVIGTGVTVDVLGQAEAAQVVEPARYDADGVLMRG